jgi:predicted RNA binding protein YcfA (HicA-like mRNA interferase family)
MPSEVRFSELRRVLEAHGWSLSRVSGSHHVFTKAGKWPISIPVHGGKVKAVYAHKVEKLLRDDEE